MENSGTLERLRNDLLFYTLFHGGIKKDHLSDSRMLYCSICESNEISGRKEHQVNKWVLENKKTSELNNYTFEMYKMILTDFA